MKPVPQIDPPDTLPVADILKRHGAKLQIHSVRGTSYQTLCEELVETLEAERHRTAAVVSNLNAILNQYQVTASSLKSLQARQDEMLNKAQRSLLELTQTEETETKGN